MKDLTLTYDKSNLHYMKASKILNPSANNTLLINMICLTDLLISGIDFKTIPGKFLMPGNLVYVCI